MTTAVTRIFFSYARSDADFVLRVARALRAGGRQVWVDQLDIPKGARWDDEVEKALKACTCQLVVMSPASASSSNVMDEVSYALGDRKTVIPLLYKASDVPFRLKRLQYVDFTGDFDEAYAQLLSALPDDTVPAPSPGLAPTPAPAPISVDPATLPRARPMVPAALAGGVAVVALGVYLALPGRQPSPVADGPSPSLPAVAEPAVAAAPAPPQATAQPMPVTLKVDAALTPPPVVVPPAAAVGSDQQLRDFVDQYLAAQSHASAAELLGFYADKVDFYDQRGVDHDFILKDKTAYYKRWPQVQKRLAGSVQIERPAGGGTYALSYPVQYHVTNPARGDAKSGSVHEDVVLREVDGRLLIVSQREQTLSAGK
jgi:hypothetical protein